MLIDRQSGAAEALSSAGYKLHSVTTLTNLLDYYEKNGKVSADQIEIARKFIKQQHVKIYPIFRALLFRLNPEYAHKLTLSVMRLAGNIQTVNAVIRSIYSAPAHPVQAFGLDFR